MATIAQLIAEAATQLRPIAAEDARLEAELLYAHAAGIDRTHVLARFHDEVPHGVRGRFRELLGRRLAREPLAYITGRREFYGIDIACGPGALIPRPETEMLVDFAVEEIARRGAQSRIIDVGTGSGAIAVAIAANTINAHIVASDASENALDIARRNIESHGFSHRIDLVRADMLLGLGMFDVVLANLPYIAKDEWSQLATEICDHEPTSSLVGGARGTEAIEELLVQAPSHLTLDGVVAAEIGETQGAHLAKVAASSFPEADVYVMKDFAGKDRVLIVRVKGGRSE